MTAHSTRSQPDPAADALTRGDVPVPTEHHWPGLETPPRSRVRTALARAFFTRLVAGAGLRVELPGGRTLGRGGREAPTMRVIREDALFRRIGADEEIGFGEAYMAGDWDADDLPGVLGALAIRFDGMIPPAVQRLRGRRWFADEGNTPSRARENVRRTYDLSNEMFALFLDETMQYSAAWFEPGDSLTDAQVRKIDAILDMARVRSDSHLLELGTGWGGLALRAASARGARVTGVTLSTEQKAFADQRIAAAGLSDRVDVILRDYREVTGQYDAVAAVEMMEHVGARHWPAFLSAIDRLLRPGGRVGLQAITMPHARMLASRNRNTWIRKYIFPGGLLPSVKAIEDILARHTTLRVVERRDLRVDYVETLRQWRERFLAHRSDIIGLGFDETFIRMWNYYLAYSEAGFRTEFIGDSQLGLTRT